MKRYTRVLQVCAFVLASAYVFVGCEASDRTPPAQSVTIDNVVAGAGSITFRVQNPNAEAVRVTIELTPSPPDAARMLIGNVSNTVANSVIPLPARGTQENILISDLTSGELYTITLTTADSNGNQQSQKATEIATPLPPDSAPQNPSVTAADRRVSLSWTAPSSGGTVSGYRVYRATSGGKLTLLTTPELLPAATRTYTDISVTNGTRYSYTVRAVVSGGTENASSVVVSATPLATPNAPTALSATAGNGEALLRWAAPTGGISVTQYYIYRVEGANIDAATRLSPTAPAMIAGTTYTDTTAANGTAYSYVVRAVNSNGTESANSNTVSATPFAPEGAPTSLAAAATDGNVSLTWTPPADTSMVSGYRIYRAAGIGTFALLPTTPTILSAATFTYTDSAVTNGTEYRYTVRAVTANGAEKADSEVARATPLAPPDAPANFSANGGDGIVTLTWSAPTDGSPVSQYYIYRALGHDTSPLTQLPTLITITGTTYVDTNVSNDIDYSYTIRAVTANGTESASSEIANATPLVPPDAPTNLRVSIENVSAMLSWAAPARGTPVTQYYVYRVEGTNIDRATRLSATITGTNYVDSSIVDGIEYSYVVRAVNVNNTQSANSNTVNITSSIGAVQAFPTVVANEPQIMLRWYAIEDASEYQIYRTIGEGSEARLTTTPSVFTDTTYVDSDIVYGREYRYRVQAIVGGEMGFSSETARITAPIDSDGDTLIDIHNLDMLNNMRYNLRGTSYKTSESDSGLRCGTDGATVCTGYELMRDLDFFVADDYAAPDSATGRSWQPVGGNPASFDTLFEGNGRSIRNIDIRNTANTNDSRFGFFGQTSGNASLRNFAIENGNAYGGTQRDHVGIVVGVNSGSIINVIVRGGNVRGGDGNDEIGGLAGWSNGTIISSSSSAAVSSDEGANNNIGGLVGQVAGGSITASYASGAVDGGTGNDEHVGGLVGRNIGLVRASYALGNANGNDGTGDVVGGLVGRNQGGTIIASYATGNADGGDDGNDHVGKISGFSDGTITASYGFGTVSGAEVTPAGSDGTTLPSGATTAAQLTAPASASGAVAAEWNQASSSTMGAWDFGDNNETPVLRYADYDGTGSSDYCALFSSVVPGTTAALTCGTTLLPGQDRGSSSSIPFDLTVSSSTTDTILLTSDSARDVDFTAVVRNAYDASTSPATAMATNAGATTLTYYRSTDSVRNPDADTPLSPVSNVPAIAGGAMDEQTVAVPVPGDAGTYYYYACVSTSPKSDTERNVESNTANNCSFVTTIAVIPPIDSDGDTLIEIQNLDMLDHVRNNLAGTSYIPIAGGGALQCGSDGTTACTGYELTRDLDFAVAADYANGTVNMEWRPTAGGSIVAPGSATNGGWLTIGNNTSIFNTIFEGNGYKISNLYIRNMVRGREGTGLFQYIGTDSTLRNLLIENGNVYGNDRNDRIGVAAGWNYGSIVNVAIRGGSVHGGGFPDYVGGLVGRNEGSIVASSSNAAVYGDDHIDEVGGLVGLMLLDDSSIIASYASGAVYGGTGQDEVGGLVGQFQGGAIRASYARGDVEDADGSGDRTGGLVGIQTGGSVIASYAVGNVHDGDPHGASDYVGALAGFRGRGTGLIASYGFGSATGNVNIGDAGSTLPTGATTASQLTIPVAMETPDTAVPADWNQMTMSTLNAWDFGTDTENPALRYADYDGTGGTDYCGLFTNVPGTSTAITCGTTLLPHQERGGVAPRATAFDLSVLAPISPNTALANQPITIYATVRNIPFAPSSPTATITYYRSADDTVDTTNDTAVGTDEIPPIAGGAVGAPRESTNVPATPGVYYYYACVVAASDSNTANNCSSPVAVRVIAPIDSDGDKLIDIRNLDMLNNVRHNLDGTSYKTGPDSRFGAATFRCGTPDTPADCAGYELTRDLDFAVAGDYESGAVNMDWRPTADERVVESEDATNRGWSPIDAFLSSVFEGNGYTVRNLYSRNTASNTTVGLFDSVGADGMVRNLLIENGDVYGGSGNEYVGMAVGQNLGSVVNVAVRGGNAHGGGGSDEVGGLVGRNQGGVIAASSSNAAVYGGGGFLDKVGGLVGLHLDSNSLIIASYASGAASGGTGRDTVGGLVGDSNGAIYASYARGDAGADTGNNQKAGGLVGQLYSPGAVTASYAIGHADAGTGSDNSVGMLVGDLHRASNVAAEASYGFGVASGNDVPDVAGMNGPDGGSEKPSGVTNAAQFTAPGSAAATAVPAEWNQADSRSMNAWDFGTDTQNPALRYADYDGAGGTDYCALFSNIPGTSTAITCGTTLLPWQERTQVTRTAFDFAVSASTDLALISTDAPLTFTAIVQNMPFTGVAPTATLTYYRSIDNVVNINSDTVVGTAPVPALIGGLTNTQDMVIIPTVEGRHYYYACVNIEAGELDATNNCSEVIQVRVRRARDIAIVSSRINATKLRIRNSIPVTFSVTVSNLGAIATSAPTVLSYYRSTNNTVNTSSDTNIGSDIIPILVTNAISAQNIMITAPATAGNYYYYACVPELPGENVTNNCSTPALVQVLPALSLTVTPASVISTSIRVGWDSASEITNPTLTIAPLPTGFTIPSVTGNSFLLPVSAAVDTLSYGTEYTFTVSGMQLGSATEAATTATPTPPIVLWSDGMHQGDFGFARCQTGLDADTPANAVTRALKSAGYTKSAFFGSTSSYTLSQIHTDEDALGATAVTTDVDFGNRSIAIAYEENGTVQYVPITNGVGQPTLTISQAIRTTTPTSKMVTWSSAGTRDALQTLIGTESFWSMTDVVDDHRGILRYPATAHCENATSALSSKMGRTGNATMLLDTDTEPACDTRAHVLCVAR